MSLFLSNVWYYLCLGLFKVPGDKIPANLSLRLPWDVTNGVIIDMDASAVMFDANFQLDGYSWHLTSKDGSISVNEVKTEMMKSSKYYFLSRNEFLDNVFFVDSNIISIVPGRFAIFFSLGSTPFN